MSDPSIMWLKALIIAVASCPIVFVWIVIYVNLLIFIGRNTKENIKQTLAMTVGIIFASCVLIPWLFALRLQGYAPQENFDWAFLVWVTILHILSLSPSYIYLFKRRPDLERVGIIWR